MTDTELAAFLINHAAARQRIKRDDYAEVNEVPALREAGNARIANMLELLGKHQIVADVLPIFSEHGLGFSYRIESALVDELVNRDLIEQLVSEILEGAPSETADTLAQLLRECERTNVNAVYRDDLLASIRELRLCFAQECYIACLALSGKLLEICLKQVLIDNEIDFDDKCMIGQLIAAFQRAHLEKYLDQSLPDIAKIINRSRIPAVHAVEHIPVPSKDQAIMVIHAVVDTVNRVIVTR
jgi:hypothetical protein